MTFNTAFPTNNGITITGGTFTLPNLYFTSTSGWNVYSLTGLSYTGNIYVTITGYSGVNYSAIKMQTCTINGLISITYAAGHPNIQIIGGSYYPPAVYTPAIRSGNYMTFAASAIPIDWGFSASGGTFSPTILLSGTSNDILGAGLP